MAFLSGLKAAYDTLGSEITKTFDSSKESQSSVTEDGKDDQELPPGVATTGQVRKPVPYCGVGCLSLIITCVL